MVPSGGAAGCAGHGGEVEELSSEVAGLQLQLVEALEELEARERELREAGDQALGQQQKMQALSDQVRRPRCLRGAGGMTLQAHVCTRRWCSLSVGTLA